MRNEQSFLPIMHQIKALSSDWDIEAKGLRLQRRDSSSKIWLLIFRVAYFVGRDYVDQDIWVKVQQEISKTLVLVLISLEPDVQSSRSSPKQRKMKAFWRFVKLLGELNLKEIGKKLILKSGLQSKLFFNRKYFHSFHTHSFCEKRVVLWILTFCVVIS